MKITWARTNEHAHKKTYCTTFITIISCKNNRQCCEKGYRYNSIRIQMPKYCFQSLCHLSRTHNSLPHKCTQYLTCPVFHSVEMKTNYGLCPVPLIWSPNTKEFHKRGANLLILPNLFATHANMILFKKKTPNNRLFYSFILQI